MYMASPPLWSSSCDPNIMPLVAADPLKITELYYITTHSHRSHKLFPMCSALCVRARARVCVGARTR
jgi:hypothetical protein